MHAVSAHWLRQDAMHSIAAVLALHPYRRVEHLLQALYTLDMLKHRPGPCHRRPRRRRTAGTVMIPAKARAILSSPLCASSSRAPLGRRLHDAVLTLPFRAPQEPRHGRALAAPHGHHTKPAGARTSPSTIGATPSFATATRRLSILDNVPRHQQSTAGTLMEPIIPTEPFIQTQVYDLANDQFSLRENTWVDGLAHALQESLARLCGQNSLAIEGERFAHFARHSSVGLPLSLPYHPVLRHHVDHLDYMLYETRSALSNSRSAANHTQQQLNQYADTIKVIAKERRTLRQLVAKRDATIHRLKTKIAVLKETISTQVEQLQILEGEGEGEDIQGDGYSYVSNDNDYEPEEEEDRDFHQHLPAGMDTTFPLRIDG
ncbi:hypothetical protein QYE76_040197 [Lolium multiflorum]|uniref:Uncharacterized protein n=1 Tax=Lolium multiflorum TaxID=4521 RepID=A0AAD8TCN5_LOLMU|nr:hypothetical protein QYE76_040197 [Lolium multiflorum]